MATKTWLFPILSLTAWITGCGGPFLLLPGGALEGAITPTPESWAFTDAIKTVQLETLPTDPYSVNIWVITDGEALFIHAGANRATWVENMEADPKVRVRIEGSVYELAATRVDDQNEFDRFSDAYEKKYGRRPRNGDVSEAYLFRLAAR